MSKRFQETKPPRYKHRARKSHPDRGDAESRHPKKYARQKFSASIDEDDDFYKGH